MKLIGKKYKVNKNKNLKDSFLHAYEGINYAITKERNMHIHVAFSVVVIAAGAFFRISYCEWLICLGLIGLVISLEMINTAIEAIVDMITTKEDPNAKVAKDTAAGAVLVSSCISALIGFAIFLPKIFEFLMNL